MNPRRIYSECIWIVKAESAVPHNSRKENVRARRAHEILYARYSLLTTSGELLFCASAHANSFFMFQELAQRSAREHIKSTLRFQCAECAHRWCWGRMHFSNAEALKLRVKSNAVTMQQISSWQILNIQNSYNTRQVLDLPTFLFGFDAVLHRLHSTPFTRSYYRIALMNVCWCFKILYFIEYAYFEEKNNHFSSSYIPTIVINFCFCKEHGAVTAVHADHGHSDFQSIRAGALRAPTPNAIWEGHSWLLHFGN